MTEEIRQMFVEHRPPDGQSLSFDPEDLVAGGKRRRKRRAVGIVAGAVLVVAALTAGALALPQFVTDRSDAAVEEVVEQPEYPFPDLEPPEDGYYYQFEPKDPEGKRSDAADEYGEAFVDWFKTEYKVTFADWPGVRVFDDELVIIDESSGVPEKSTGHSLPRYRIAPAGPEGEEDLDHRFDGRDHSDGFFLTVYPKASFKSGSGEELGKLTNCEDRTEVEAVVDMTCTESAGPDGEKIVESTEVRTENGTGDLWQVTHDVVLYRANGTAIVVTDNIPAMTPDAPFELDEGDEPYLSTEDLIDLAVSMPDAIVEE